MTKDKNRIKGNSRTGKGDSGFTELIKNYTYPKSDELCFIYNYFQSTTLKMQKYLNKYKHLLDNEDVDIIEIFQTQVMFDVPAIMWSRFDDYESKINKLTINTKQIVEDRNQYLNDYFPNAEEFIVFTATEVCDLADIWINFRNLEHLVWKCIHRFHSYDSSSIPKQIKEIGSFFNLVGDYFYNLCRYIQKKLNVNETYWKH